MKAITDISRTEIEVYFKVSLNDISFRDLYNHVFSRFVHFTLKHDFYDTKFGNKMFCSPEYIIQTFTDILTFAVSLTLNTAIQVFHRTLWLMMLYYQTKFGCKPTNSLEDKVEIVIS